MRTLWRLGALTSFVAAGAQTQVVRGVALDSATGAPLPGVLVSLERATGELAAREQGGVPLAYAVLSDALGRFAIRAPGAGRFVITFRQVGLKRYLSDPVDLATAETRSLDVRLIRIARADLLPEVGLSAATPCRTSRGDGVRIAALWEAASTIIASQEVAARDALFAGGSYTYERELAVGSLEVLRERWTRHTSDVPSRFASVPARTLSDVGFVAASDGGIEAYAPDAQALMSQEFLRDHCFAVVPATDRDTSVTGLGFEPVPTRRVPEIRGVLDLDARTSELRRLSFRYVNVPRHPPDPEARGEMEFARLPTGAWVVRRWFIRLPEYARDPTVPNARRPVRYRERGGQLDMDEARPALALRGRVVDSTGRAPLSGAAVWVSSALDRTLVTVNGEFTVRRGSLGELRVIADHPGYAALGLYAAQRVVHPDSAASPIGLVALDSRAVAIRLCGPDGVPSRRSGVRVVVRDSLTGEPVAGAFVRALWYAQGGPGANTQVLIPGVAEGETDRDGALMMCRLPSRLMIRFETDARSGERPVFRVLLFAPQTVSAVELRR